MTCTDCGGTGTVLVEAPPDAKSRGGLRFLVEEDCPCTYREAEDLLDLRDNLGLPPVAVRIVEVTP